MLLTESEPAAWPQTVEEFGLLVERTQHELVQFAAYQLGNRVDAEDIVQDTYVEAFRQRAAKRHITEVRAYLFRMVRNRCIDRLRTRVRMGGVPADRASGDDLFRSQEARERSERIGAWMAKIPDNEAEVIEYRIWAGLTFAEIAAAAGSSVPTVKSRFRYGIEKLRRLMKASRFPIGGVQ